MKYRIWNPEVKEYDKNLVCLQSSEICYTEQYNISGQTVSNAIIERCTDLKDKNGILIYEGDIVKKYKVFDIYKSNKKRIIDIIGKITWGEYPTNSEVGDMLTDTFVFVPSNQPYEYEDPIKALQEINYDITVIGNIHQNP